MLLVKRCTEEEREPSAYFFPGDDGLEHAEIRRPLDGDLSGWDAVTDLMLDDEDEIRVGVIRFEPQGEPPRVLDAATGRALRSVSLASILDLLRQLVTLRPEGRQEMAASDSAVARAFLSGEERWLTALNQGKRRGRARSDVKWLALWAQRRVEAQQADPRRPIKWMHETYGSSEASINALLHRARRNYELLEGTPPRLTDKALKILKGDD